MSVVQISDFLTPWFWGFGSGLGAIEFPIAPARKPDEGEKIVGIASRARHPRFQRLKCLGSCHEQTNWRLCPPRENVDRFLFEKVREDGGQVYRKHGAGFVLVRYGGDHTWDAEGAWFLDKALAAWPGREPDRARIEDMDASYVPAPIMKPL